MPLCVLEHLRFPDHKARRHVRRPQPTSGRNEMDSRELPHPGAEVRHASLDRLRELLTADTVIE